MEKPLTTVIIVLFVVVLIEISYLTFFLKPEKKASPKALTQQKPSPSPPILTKTDEPERRKIYPAKSLSTSQFEGVGIVKNSDVFYVVGYFKKWQPIEGGQDYYLILENPQQPKEEFVFRAGIGSPYFNAAPTILAVESVDKVARAVEVTVDDLDFPLFSLNPTQIKNLIRSGDVVIVVPFFDQAKNEKRDENGVILASYLVLRRKGGKEEIKNELTKTP
jgi:hypothetical protein